MNLRVPRRRTAKMCSNCGYSWGREWVRGKQGSHMLYIVIVYSAILQWEYFHILLSNKKEKTKGEKVLCKNQGRKKEERKKGIRVHYASSTCSKHRDLDESHLLIQRGSLLNPGWISPAGSLRPSCSSYQAPWRHRGAWKWLWCANQGG